MAENKNMEKKRSVPARGSRIDYRALNEGVGVEKNISLQNPGFLEQDEQGLPGAYFGDQTDDEERKARVGETSSREEELEEIQRMREEFEELQRVEDDLRRKKLLVEERRKLEAKKEVVAKLRGMVSFDSSDTKDASVRRKTHPQKKVSVQKDKSDGKKNVTLSDLRKDVKLKEQVKTQMKNVGLDILFSSESDSDTCSLSSQAKSRNRDKLRTVALSDSESESESDEKHKETWSSSASDSDSGNKNRRSRRGKSKKKSGISAKANDTVVNMQRYPHSQLRFEFVQNAISFEKLDMNLFIAGELEIISSSSIGKSERKGRTDLLKRLMYLNSSYEFSVIRSLYAAVLREIELGHLEWGDSFMYVENAVLRSKKQFSSVKRGKFSKEKAQNDVEEKLWFCSQFQRNKCSQKSPHTLVVKGVMRLAHHICASCWLKDKIKLEHPECSSSCPHARD